MLTEQQIADFRRDGFLVYPDRVLSDTQLRDLNAALARVLAGESAAKPEHITNLSDTGVVTQVVNIWEAEPAFRAHLYNAEIVPMVAQLLGTDTVRVWHDQIQVKPPLVGGPTIWHQDHPYWPVIEPADLISAWVALEDATISNGCMSMVPRSYKWGSYAGGTIGNEPETHAPTYKRDFVPEGETVEVVPIEVPAGHVVFHHCLTWHGAPPNASERNRPAIAVHYMPGYTRYEPKGLPHIVEKHIHVAAGEPLTGEHFPTVLEHGQLLNPNLAPA